MRLRIKDDVYDVDEGKVTVAEAKALKRHAGMTVLQWRDGLATGDPDASIFLMYLAWTRDGRKADWSSFDDIDLVSDVELILDDAPDDQRTDTGQGRADPTGTSGQTRKTGSTSTSRRSRSTSGSTRAKSTS